MRASIIIVCYNGVKYLENCLSSLNAEIKDDEIIIIDNASTDGSICLVQQFLPGVKLIVNENNCGFAAACNQGAREATGEYLVFLNQDTQVCSGWLAGLLEPFRGSPTLGLTTSKLLLMSQPEKINMGGQDIHFTGLVFSRGFLAPADSLNEPTRIGAVSGAAFSIRRELWKQLGGFDEIMYMYYEDTDLSWRARLAGYHTLYAPDSRVYHDYYPAQPDYQPLYYARRNRYILLLKCWGWLTLLLISPSLLLAELLDWLYTALIGKRGLSAKLRASVWLLTHMPSLIVSRQKVQRNKRASDLILLEQCVDYLNPVEFKGGFLGGFALPVVNALFYINAELTRRFLHLVTV